MEIYKITILVKSGYDVGPVTTTEEITLPFPCPLGSKEVPQHILRHPCHTVLIAIPFQTRIPIDATHRKHTTASRGLIVSHITPNSVTDRPQRIDRRPHLLLIKEAKGVIVPQARS